MAKDSDGRRMRWEGIGERREEILNVRREMTRRSSMLERTVERVGDVLAHPAFLLGLFVSHAGWIVLNLGLIPGLVPWDPPPFVLLATIASAEAPFIALLILMAQSRSAEVDELREEVALQVSLYVEQQTSAALRMLGEIQEALGVESAEEDETLKVLAEPVDPARILDQAEEGIEDEGG